MRTEDIIRLIKESKKKTPCVAYLSGDLEGMDAGGAVFVGGKDFGILAGDRA
jgi:2,3,4,5-tetrahydropyridine-2-carboxylate N-succinyltransferase/tetrahydrodipicolinate N-acetyltransferase